MLNSLRDGQINYGTTTCPSAHVPPHNVVAPIHQNALIPSEPTTPVVYPWNSNPRLDHLYGFHSRYYNLDFPTPYPPSTNQYVPPSMYGQNVPQCCQPCCRLRSQNIPKTSPPQVLYNPIRPVQQLNRSYKPKKTVKTPCSEQFLPYIPNDLPVKYDTQNCYQPKYSSSYLNNTSYCPPANNLWIPPTTNPTWSTDRLRPIGRHTSVVTHDFSRDNYQRLPNYQSNPYSNPTSVSHRPYNNIPPVIPDVHDYRPPVYHNQLKNNISEYISHEHNSKQPISSQSNESSSSLQQYYNTQSVPYLDVQKHNEITKSHNTPKNSSKSNLNVREFLATWDEGEEEISEKSTETTAPIVVLDCMTLEGDALTKVQEKLNVVSYENLEKVLKENQNPIVINTESNAIDSIHNKTKPPSKSNFEPLDYTKRETGIIKPFITEKKISPEINSQAEKSYSVNFDGMVAWYGKKNTDISSTDLIEKLADRIFNLSKSQENEGVSFGTASYTGQITQTNRSIEDTVKDSSKYIQSQQIFDLQHHTDKCAEPSVINKTACNNDSFPRIHSHVLNESNKISTIKSNNVNSSCIVENITKKCLNISNTNGETTPWNLDQGSTQEQHLNMSLYDHSVIMKPLDFSSLTDETKGNPFVFEKNTPSGNKPNNSIINDQFNKVLNENNNYNCTISNNQHSMQQIDSSNRNFPVIVSPHIHRQEYNGFHESVIQRTGCGKNKHDKVPTQTDFESMNWNISNDLDKIMKTTNIAMEPSCLYDRNNYNVLDSMNSEKMISTHNQWKDNVPCVDLSANNKTNSNHDSFFDNWNFIESYENHSNKKMVNPPSNNNNNNNDDVHNPLFPNQISLEKLNNKINNSDEKIKNETLVTIKDIPFSKSNNISSNNTHTRDVFNLNNRIPDFSDGFELTVNEPHDYMQFKKLSNDNEHRTDGSIFEHFTEPKCTKVINETTINAKNDQIKPDIVGLPSFKDKEPLAPMPMPPKLNIVKPIIRDPSQIYSVIKQKLKYDTSCVENDNVVSNKTGHHLRGNPTNIFNGTDLKSKYNNVQLNQFDVWSEKFVLKNNSNNLSSSVVQCDVEITQFKSTPENRITLLPKPNINENYQDKNTKLPENTNCNLISDKMNIIENDKMNTNDFLNCLESTKTNDQKYRDTLDEFETSFGFDIHCNNESNKSYHEDIVDKCLEETIKDKIGEHNINTNLTNSSNSNTIRSDNTQLSFQCNFESGYLIKNYFDENKNKAVVLQQKQSNNQEKLNTSFNYHSEIENDFELQNNKNIDTISNSEKNSNFIQNCVKCDIEHIKNDTDGNSSNQFRSSTKLKHSFEPNQGSTNISKVSNTEKNHFSFLSIKDGNFEFENNKKCTPKSTESEEITRIHNLSEDNICKIKYSSDSSIHQLSNNPEKSNLNVDFESISRTNIFETNSNTSSESTTEINENHKLQNNNGTLVDSTFHSNDAGNIEHQINNKSIFQLETDNNMYQTQNLDKINVFDFETRINKNFDLECSNSIKQGPTTKKTEYLINTKYNYEINDKENNVRTESNCKSISSMHDDSQIKEMSDLDCNDNPKCLTNNINQKNKTDQIFKVGCITDNIHEKLNSETHIDFVIQNENTKEINMNNCNTHENSNTNNNDEVEKIFENIYDNLTTLNTDKKNYNLSEHQVDNNCDISKNLDNIDDQSLKMNNSIIVNQNELKIDACHDESNKIFKETGNVLLQEFVNNSTYLTTVSLQQNDVLKEENNKELTQLEYNTKELEHIPIRNEFFSDISNKIKVCENIAIFKEQNDNIKQNDLELENQNNIQAMKNTMASPFQDDITTKIFEDIKSDFLNAVKDTDIICDDEHSQNNNTKPSLLNQIELTDQQHFNGIVEVEDLINSKSSTLINNVDFSSKKHDNNIFEAENSINSRSCSLNNDKFTYQEHSNNNIEVDELTSSESNSSNNNVKFSCQENHIDEVDDSADHIEFICQKSPNRFVENDDLTSSESSSLNSVKCTEQKSANEIFNAEDLVNSEPSILNSVEYTSQKYSNDVDIEDSTGLLSHVEFIRKEPVNEIADAKHTITSMPSSVNKLKITRSEDSDEFVEVEDLINSEWRPSNLIKSTSHEHVNKMVYTEDSINSELTQQNSNDLIKIQDSTNFGSKSLNEVENTNQEYVSEISGDEDSISSVPSPLNHSKCMRQQDSDNYTVEVENSTYSRPSSSNHVESSSQQYFNDIFENSNSVKSLVLSVNNNLKTNDSRLEITDSKNAADDIKSPRVKFMLKCHNKSMIKKNVFEEESTAPYKKSSITINNKTLITRHIFKKRNCYFKPWQSIYRKKQVGEPKEVVVETAYGPDDVLKNNNFVSVDGEKVHDLLSMSESNALAGGGERPNVKSNNVENEKYDSDPFVLNTVDDDDLCIPFDHELRTPIPSPFDDFESVTETPDYCSGGEEYWDKSLENEYKNVLHKTISKLAKCRVHIRDKYNTRLLARRANGGVKQRKRKRRQSRRRRLLDESTTKRIDDSDPSCTLSKPVAVTVTKTTNPRCKIKVQLPWGRIFNLNNQNNRKQNTDRDTKIELGPAKVEVRLSRTPGEWQVAGCCRSTASSMSVVNVRRLVLQRAASPAIDCDHGCNGFDDADSGSGSGSSGTPPPDERSRKLPKIVIRRIGQDNNYTSYVRSGGGIEGGDNVDGVSPRLIVRLVRDQKLDAMAADGVTTLNLKHLVPIDESAADTHDAKRVRYT